MEYAQSLEEELESYSMWEFATSTVMPVPLASPGQAHLLQKLEQVIFRNGSRHYRGRISRGREGAWS